jgi:hypothetical protein
VRHKLSSYLDASTRTKAKVKRILGQKGSK